MNENKEGRLESSLTDYRETKTRDKTEKFKMIELSNFSVYQMETH